MPLMPVFVGGKVRLVQMAAGAGAKDLARAEEENVRRAGVYKRRLYYGGEQYDEENAEGRNLGTYDDPRFKPIT